jgi:ATP-dependent DNA helicase RecG
MSIETFLENLASGESLEVEFKAAKAGLPQSLWETVSAFANTSGGYILLGVAQVEGRPAVQGLGHADRRLQEFFDLMRNRNKISAEVCGPGDVRVERLGVDDILVIRVRASSAREKPVFLRGNPYQGTYVRRNEGDYRCSEQEVNRMIRDASEDGADLSIVSGASWSELSMETFERYRQRFRQFSPASPWNDYDNQRFLTAIGGWRNDFQTGAAGVTRAAILMFGTPEAIHGIRPRHLIDFRLVPDGADAAQERWEDRIAWEGNLYDAFSRIYPRLIEPLKTPFQLAGPYRLNETDTHVALRECLVNLLVHADYAEPAALLIKVSLREFFFRNPGSSRVSENDLMLGDRSDPRNPILLRMFRYVSLADEAGTGFPKILRVWNDAGLELPSIVSDSEQYEFALRLKLIHLLSEGDRRWLAACARYQVSEGQLTLPGTLATPAYLTQHEQTALLLALKGGTVSNASVQAVTKLHPTDVTAVLTGLRDRGLLVQQSARRWASYRISDALLKEYKEGGIVATYAQKPIDKTYPQKPIDKTYPQEAIGKRVPERKADLIVNRILAYCSEPRTAEEIAAEIGKNRVYVVQRYLTPLIKSRRLQYTNPEHPHAPNQRYVVSSSSGTPE